MPRAVFWYRIYCWLVVLFNLGLFGVSVWFIARHDALANEFVSSSVVFWVGVFCVPFSLFLLGANIWLVLAARRGNAWALHMSNIAVGLGTIVLVPIALPLFLCWFRPAVRAWYERGKSDGSV